MLFARLDDSPMFRQQVKGLNFGILVYFRPIAGTFSYMFLFFLPFISLVMAFDDLLVMHLIDSRNLWWCMLRR